MLESTYPMYLAGKAVCPNTDLEVENKYTGACVTRCPLAGGEEIEAAIHAAERARHELRRWPAFRRRAVLDHLVGQVESEQTMLAEVLAIEAGKPIKDARGEVMRAIDTLRLAAEESTRMTGEYLPLEISPRAEGYEGLCRRVPIGPCSFITPFNFPLNLVAHKVGPAIAAGCPFILKPSERTPISALLLGRMLAETDLPRGAFSILPCLVADAGQLVADDRIRLLSFTGSVEVGWKLKSQAGRKRVALELGGNAACIVDETADLEHAVRRIVHGAYYQSGQSCISVQRIFVHEKVFHQLLSLLLPAIEALKSGDPLDESTFIGPIISEEHARRIEQWIHEAVRRGASLLAGGSRDGRFIAPTLLTGVDPQLKVSCDEVFGPVALIDSFRDFEDAVARANDSRFGLQAGLFTRDIHRVFQAFHELEVGGVIINDVPSIRVDAMPYGGVKDSGLGREGVRYAIEEMTERRLLVLSGIGR